MSFCNINTPISAAQRPKFIGSKSQLVTDGAVVTGIVTNVRSHTRQRLGTHGINLVLCRWPHVSVCGNQTLFFLLLLFFLHLGKANNQVPSFYTVDPLLLPATVFKHAQQTWRKTQIATRFTPIAVIYTSH